MPSCPSGRLRAHAIPHQACGPSIGEDLQDDELCRSAAKPDTQLITLASLTSSSSPSACAVSLERALALRRTPLGLGSC